MASIPRAPKFFNRANNAEKVESGSCCPLVPPRTAASPTPESAPHAPNPTTSERYLPKISEGVDGGPG